MMRQRQKAKGKGNREKAKGCVRTRSCSPLQDLHQPGGSVEAHKQLASAQVGGRDGCDVVQHIQLVHILEGNLLAQLEINEMKSLLGCQFVLTQQLHQERG